MKDLLPCAIRIYDTERQKYLPETWNEGQYQCWFEMSISGILRKYRMHIPTGEIVGFWSAVDIDGKPLPRYLIERWTGRYDLDKKPVYVGDAVTFKRYDAGTQMRRFEYQAAHPGVSQEELDAAVPQDVEHLIRGVTEGRDGDFDLDCLSKNDAMWLGHKDFRKYRNGFRVIGNVHEPFADLAARVPEYVDHLAGGPFDQGALTIHDATPALCQLCEQGPIDPANEFRLCAGCYHEHHGQYRQPEQGHDATGGEG